MAKQNDLELMMAAWMEAYVSHFPFSGLVKIRGDQKELFSFKTGFADREKKLAIHDQSRFPIASLSKAFTAVLILKLWEEGLLDLERPVEDYLPGILQNGSGIQTHHLLCHSSGLADYQVPAGAELHEIFARKLGQAEWLETLLDPQPRDKPGARFDYSNPGYYLLGMIAERLAGKPFEELLEDRIFKPLGLENSMADLPAFQNELRTIGYEYEGGEIVKAPFTDAQNFLPQGGLLSTAQDLEIWNQALLSPGFLSQESLDLMFDKHIMIEPERGLGYGYGWHVFERGGDRVVGHGGSHWGWRHQFERSPARGFSALVLGNFAFQDSFRVAANLMRIFWGQEVEMPGRPEPLTGDLSWVEELLGEYGKKKSSYSPAKFWIEGSRCFIRFGERPAAELIPIGQDLFAHTFLDQTYEFRRGEDGIPEIFGMRKLRND